MTITLTIQTYKNTADYYINTSTYNYNVTITNKLIPKILVKLMLAKLIAQNQWEKEWTFVQVLRSAGSRLQSLMAIKEKAE